MTKKKTVYVPIILLLIASITTMGIPPVHAQQPLIFLDPDTITVPEPGQNFTIAVKVANVTDMKGFSIKVDFNATIINAIRIDNTTISAGAPVKLPVDENLVFHWDAYPTIDNTTGRVWVSFFGFTAFNGSGSILTINFTATAVGNTTLHFNTTELLNSAGDQILHTVDDGNVTVIPEFPTILLIPLLLILALAATFLRKMLSLKKHKEAFVPGRTEFSLQLT